MDNAMSTARRADIDFISMVPSLIRGHETVAGDAQRLGMPPLSGLTHARNISRAYPTEHQIVQGRLRKFRLVGCLHRKRLPSSDSQVIFREIERRTPEPTLFPNKEYGLPFALSRWTDGAMFDLAMRVSFAPVADNLPRALVADRARLYLGPDGDFKKEVADLPHVLAQLRPQLGWFEAQLAADKLYLVGDKPGMADLLAWFLVWFLRGRNPRADELLGEFPALLAWEARMKTIGHGRASSMTPAEALAVCKATDPLTKEKSDPLDPQGLAPGMRVAVTPISVGGEAAVTGHIIALDRDTIVIRRNGPACGIVAVHFPRVGYRVTVL